MRTGFVGAGIMGRGMAKNLLRSGHALTVIAHNNRAPIEELVASGAQEASSHEALANASDTIVLCVTGNVAASEVIGALRPFLRPSMMVIDTSTNPPDATIAFAALLSGNGVSYVESPVSGGVKQADDGTLGGMVGCAENDFERARAVLSCFCKRVERFGEVGAGSRAKLVSNFLALGTATLVVEAFNYARALDTDWEKLYGLARLGSGRSSALERILNHALLGDYCGYVFSIENTLKDFSYICDMLDQIKTGSNQHPHLAPLMRAIYQEAAKNGHGKRMLSELLDPELTE